ncbi:MAG: hypothetical protein P1V97_09590 [Planctomycetota bacterium]|nr:hypothetical protein [Planctomycetota bacterium]
MARLNNAVIVVCSLSLLLFPACKDKSRSAKTDNAVARKAGKKTRKNSREDSRFQDQAKVANELENVKKDAKSWGGAPNSKSNSPTGAKSIEELKALQKAIPTTEKQEALRKRAKKGMEKSERELGDALGGKAPASADKAKETDGQKSGDIERVAPSGTFPEAAHNLYETLCQEIESVDRLISEYRKSKSKKLYIKAKMSVTECLLSARGIADEYEGYPGIDDRIADLEKKEQTLAAEKP